MLSMEYKFDMQRERKRKTLTCRNDEEWAKKWQERESEWDCAVFVYIVCLYLFQSSQNSPQNVLMMVEVSLHCCLLWTPPNLFIYSFLVIYVLFCLGFPRVIFLSLSFIQIFGNQKIFKLFFFFQYECCMLHLFKI